MKRSFASLCRRRCACFSLVLVAATSAVMWRLELEYHGWAGLNWVHYFHWSVPIGVALFLTWTAVFADFPTPKKRAAFLGLGVLLAPIFYAASSYALKLIFVAGPSALPLVVELTPDGFSLARTLAIVWLASVPLITSTIGRAFGLAIGWKSSLVSTLVFCSALPVALALMWILDAPGKLDAIHAIKTGYVIPLMVIGLGIPIMVPQREPAA